MTDDHHYTFLLTRAFSREPDYIVVEELEQLGFPPSQIVYFLEMKIKIGRRAGDDQDSLLISDPVLNINSAIYEFEQLGIEIFQAAGSSSPIDNLRFVARLGDLLQRAWNPTSVREEVINGWLKCIWGLSLLHSSGPLKLPPEVLQSQAKTVLTYLRDQPKSILDTATLGYALYFLSGNLDIDVCKSLIRPVAAKYAIDLTSYFAPLA